MTEIHETAIRLVDQMIHEIAAEAWVEGVDANDAAPWEYVREVLEERPYLEARVRTLELTAAALRESLAAYEVDPAAGDDDVYSLVGMD
jgi:16S rRNA C967 or C1407 C5-methylase (RsmB/RsmF family)